MPWMNPVCNGSGSESGTVGGSGSGSVSGSGAGAGEGNDLRNTVVSRLQQGMSAVPVKRSCSSVISA